MTAIPAEHDAAALVLICDNCGRVHDSGGSRAAWEVVWAGAVQAGWRGRDRAIGAHFCAECAGRAPRGHRQVGREHLR